MPPPPRPKRRLILIVCWFWLAVPTYSDSAFQEFYRQFTHTWDADPPEIQQKKEGTLLPKNLGGLFIPTMSASNTEPPLQIIQRLKNREEIIYDHALTNRTYILEPGQYRVVAMSGEMTFSQVVTVKLEEITILMPEWGGISFQVQDENRNYIKETFDIFNIMDKQNKKVMTFSSDNAENVDKMRTYFLPPGLYKIVLSGTSVNTEVDFCTFTLLPGHYIPYMIVLEETSRHFQGSGNINREMQQTKIRNWRLNAAWHGSFNFTHANDVTSDNFATNYLFSSTPEFQAKYDSRTHFFSNRTIMEEGWNKEGSGNLISYLDNLETKNVFILKFYKSMGIYGRFNLSTRVFPTYARYDENRTLFLFDADNRLISIHRDTRQVTLAPAFYPLNLKEGTGLNLTIAPSYRFSFYLRSGLGFSQTYNTDVYSSLSGNDSSFIRLKDSKLQGIEANLNAQIYPASHIYILTEFDMLSPFNSQNKIIYELETIINIRLLKSISLDYTLRIKQDKNISDIVQREQIVMLRYSYYFF
ncbi:MAG: hypothetical protein KBA26_15270 [Candidatus Delongbacteria bacterium]|nr:hypothetical protein [Candidatus Delongbacteria bacterium]